MKRGYLLIILISLSTLELVAQSIESTLVYANEQFEVGNYQNSALAFERVIFFSEGKVDFSVYTKLADSYRLNNNAERAIKFYDIAQYQADNDSARNEIIFRKVFTYLQLKEFDQGLIALFDLKTNSNEQTQFRKEYLKGIIYYLKDDYERSIDVFDEYLSLQEKEALKFNELKNQLKKAENIKPNLAMWLSVFIPGSGQMLYGDFKDGLNSMMLTAAFVTLYFNYVMDFSLVEGYLVVLPWFQRYHRGGYQNAKENALEKQELIRSKVYQELVLMHPEKIK
ncbi:hypothetical protein GCM10027429_07840 [Marivirga atlantica]|jgi:tetratricopeptide (TPR) repeat protein|uniref:Tetratricopeptide repeat protein n=1 Tax=Marivirga atlantica TaxID=1548457 RepID=A0A937AF05_9BACT|nr:hypothetical protein [Marivirga atlantica]MBL0764394.1 hypothetical protein [Marivirga atlantica]